jgi:hypothetical protein
MGEAEIGLLMLSHYCKCCFLNVIFLLHFSPKRHSDKMIVELKKTSPFKQHLLASETSSHD